METNLELILQSRGETDVITLKGPLLLANIFAFQNSVRASKTPSLIIDMTAVPYIDSAGIGVLIGAYVNREKDGRKLLLVGVTPRVHTALQVTKVESFFSFADTLPPDTGGA
ncbi:anti-sigma-factor antagonist [Candidatus Koribacter versatilis Ellin345]|uniref:Anti-sigma factor antagonist n=1 Tax=Koribacter versatilis (strain Ellin345) TaxID=204669 RepID=Q1IH77_KORVE|nr:STAS domain-containing protein [Candidatus Koribacter versatilis]ABF43773.1 anti-sigma-factor antagonist [Candidatus Koribacter versatilis Ellin345]